MSQLVDIFDIKDTKCRSTMSVGDSHASLDGDLISKLSRIAEISGTAKILRMSYPKRLQAFFVAKHCSRQSRYLISKMARISIMPNLSCSRVV